MKINRSKIYGSNENRKSFQNNHLKGNKGNRVQLTLYDDIVVLFASKTWRRSTNASSMHKARRCRAQTHQNLVMCQSIFQTLRRIRFHWPGIDHESLERYQCSTDAFQPRHLAN